MPRVPHHSKDDWAAQKAHIVALYKDMTQKEMMKTMEERHGFRATKKEFRIRLENWGLEKYSKPRQRHGPATISNRTHRERLSFEQQMELFIPDDSLQSLLVNAPRSRTGRVEVSGQLLESVVQVITTNIPWFQFDAEFKKHVGWMTEKLVLRPSLDWFTLTSPLGLSPAQHSIQQTKNLLGHILYGGRHCNFSTILERLDDIVPWTPALSHAHRSIDPFLHLIRSCIYLAANSLLDRGELDNFLRWILQNGYAPLLDQLLDRLGQRGGNPTLDVFHSRLLLSACSLEKPQVVMALLNRGADPNKGSDGSETTLGDGRGTWNRERASDLYPLQMAILHEDLKTVQILLHHKANPNSTTKSLPFRPLELAITHHIGSLDMVKLLLVAGADPNSPCRLEPLSPILNQHRHWKALRLVETGNILAKASNVQNMDIARYLMGEMAHVDVTFKSLDQALQIAARKSDSSMVDLFLENGADVNMVDSLGPLVRRFVIPRIEKDNQNEEWRKSRGSDDEKHEYRCSLPQSLPRELTPPVYATAARGNLDLLRRLIEHGASPHLRLDWNRILNSLSLQECHWQILRRWQAQLDSILHWAVESGSLETTEALLQKGVPVDGRDADGRTGLQVAAEQEDYDLVRLLLDWGADVNAAPSPGWGVTALQAAVEGGHNDLVEFLLDRGADVNAPPSPERGLTALQAAVEGEHYDLVELLLDRGADVNAPPSPRGGLNALQAALQVERLDIFQVLVRRGAVSTEADHWFALKIAARTGATQYLDHLSNHVENINSVYDNKETLLGAAVQGGNIAVVRKLLELGADAHQLFNTSAKPPTSSQTALCVAIWENQWDIFNLLITSGVELDPPWCTWSPLVSTAFSGRPDMTKVLLRCGADVNRPTDAPKTRWYHTSMSMLKLGAHLTTLDWTVLLCGNVQRMGDSSFGTRLLEVITILLDAGANAGSALHFACESGDVESMELLMAHDADVNAASEAGSPLEIAANRNFIEGVRALIDAGADMHPAALIVGASVGDEKLVTRLLDAKIDVNFESPRRDESALEATAKNGHAQIVRLLLSDNADPNLGHPLFWAAWRGHFNICKMLIEAGATVNPPWPPTDDDAGAFRSPLEAAALGGRLDTVSLLLENDKDVGTIEARCKRAAKVADRWGHTILGRFLREHRRAG